MDVPRRLGHAWGFRGTVGGAKGAMGVIKARFFVSGLCVALTMVLVVHHVKCDQVALVPAYGADGGWGAAEVG